MGRPTAETHAAALADYKAGLSQAAVAARHGVSESTVHEWVAVAGIARSRAVAQRLRARLKRDAEFGYHGGWEVRGGVRYPLMPERRSA